MLQQHSHIPQRRRLPAAVPHLAPDGQRFLVEL
jgi:hypothetical protein